MKNIFRKIWNVISGILVTCAVILALLLALPRVMGMNTFAILSGSMEPTYHVGSLVFTKPIDPKTVQSGDPITFMADETTIVTHRVVEVLPDQEDSSVIRFQTQGDANETPDGALVHYKNVIGKVLFSIPLMGYASVYIAQPPGLYISIIILGMFIILAMMFDHWKEEDEKERQEKALAEESENKTQIPEGI